jgi:hypothetical protein
MMSLQKLLISGNWDNAGEMTYGLLQAGFRLELLVTVRSEVQNTSPDSCLQLAAISAPTDFPSSCNRWLAWLRADDPALTLAAYQAGARVVFPPDMPPSLLAQAIFSLENKPTGPERQLSRRHIRRGDPVFLEPDSVLIIHEGVLATMMIHGDGAEVLLGLTGAGQILVAHPDDECFIQVLAHTPAVVSFQSWVQAAVEPGFAEKLRARLQRMEAWAAMQARPYLDQRVLGILSLLAEQFGVLHPDGTLIDLRLTHAQLATTVGATRTTITRVLGELRAAGKLSSDGIGQGERFILCQGVKPAHH